MTAIRMMVRNEPSAVPQPASESSPTTRGRILAVVSLFVVITGVIAQAFIADRMVGGSDAARSAAGIVANKSFYRMGYSIFMVEMAAQIATSMLFYDLLKPVNRSVARLSAIFGITGSGIKMMARLFFYAPLIVLGGAPYLSAFSPEQLASLSLLLVKINNQGAAIALILFGFEALLQGWLVYKSGFLPRFLGVMSMLGGIGWLTYLWPPLGAQVFVFVALFAIVGVILTCGWLLIRGVDDARWLESAARSSESVWR